TAAAHSAGRAATFRARQHSRRRLLRIGENMLHQPTIEKLITMRLQGMVDGLEAIDQDEAARDLSFEEKLALIVDRQYTWRQNLAFQQRLKRARLKGNAITLTDGQQTPVTWVNNVQYGLSGELLQMSYANATGYSGGACPPDCGYLE